MIRQIFTTLIIYSISSGKITSAQQESDDFKGQFSDPSAKAAVFKHIDDMAFIEAPHRQGGERARRNAIIYSDALWSNARVPYVFSSDFSESQRELVLEAMRHWEDNTCVRFHPRTNEPYYIYIISGDGCYSYVGRLRRQSQPQGLSLGPGCVYFRTAVHELGHALGFFHEHTRPDRDQYVSVITDNIRDGRERNFRKARPGATNTLGYGYDYASIMHYRGNAFSKSYRNPTIVAKDEGIVFGSAQELSPLDILKANKLYGCVAGSHPPITTHPQSLRPLSLPDGITCGGVIEGKSGTLYSPGYPRHVTNQECAWVIRVPDGYYIRLQFPNLNLEQSDGCSKDYVQVFEGQSIDSGDGIYLSPSSRNGKFCSSSQLYSYSSTYESTVTVYYRTDGSNSVSSTRGLRVDFTAIDENECSRHSCHRCTNLPGSYRCECDDGYYHSPAAKTCYDVNECAYDNGGCEHVCDNTGGSYRCLCDSGYYLQSDGLSCSLNPDPPTPSVPPPQCGGTLTSATGSFQTPSWPETYPFNFDCVWRFDLPSTGCSVELTFDEQAFGIAGKAAENCPKDHLKIYDTSGLLTHTICDLARPSAITTTDDSRLVFHAGPTHGPLRKGFRIVYRSVCPTTPPPTTRPTTVPTTRPTTVPTTRPTTVPTTTPTTVPTTQPTTDPTLLPTSSAICGPSLFTELSGSFQTPSWPETYPFNFDCVWRFDLPSTGCSVELTFDEQAFGIAGKAAENCPKDHLKIYNNNGLLTHTICDLARPSAITTTADSRLVFHAGPTHGPLRKGFRIVYRSVCPTTPPPTTRPTTVPTTRPTTVPTTIATTVPTTTPTTESTLAPTTVPMTTATTESTLAPTTVPMTTATTEPTTLPNTVPTTIIATIAPVSRTGHIQSPNWPETYPVNIDRQWIIQCPQPTSRISISLNNSPYWLGGQQLQGCTKDWVKIHEGRTASGRRFGPYCANVPPYDFAVSSNNALVVFHAGPKHHPTRVGFRLTYECLV